MCSGRHGKVNSQEESLACRACNICPSSSCWSERCCTETQPWGPLCGCVVGQGGQEWSEVPRGPPGPFRMHWHTPGHAMLFAQLCLLSLLFPAAPDEPVEGRIQSPLQGEMSQFRLLVGVPQHLWLEIPLSALPRGKETRVKLLLGLKPQEKREIRMGRAQMGQGRFVRCV